VKEIRAILKEHVKSKRLKSVSRRVDPALEASRLIVEAEPSPILLEDVGGAKVLANLLSGREDLARGLGVDPARFLPELSDVLEGRSGRKGGVVRTDKVYGEVEVPLSELGGAPFLTYYPGDGGPYLTSGVWFVKDPKHGLNLSYHRMMLGSGGRGTVRVVERRGTDTALRNSKGRLDAAVCVGAPAHVLFAASLSPALGVCELDFAAKFAPVELARCKTVDLEVPAACELVIEGRFTGEKASS
jgi:2,5-furandicarboxylate decarboxylase 1